MGATRTDRIRDEYIRGKGQVGRFGEKRRVQRGDIGYIGRKMMKMELPGKRKRTRRFMDTVREDMDMDMVGATEEDAEDRKRRKQGLMWRPLTETAERREEVCC